MFKHPVRHATNHCSALFRGLLICLVMACCVVACGNPPYPRGAPNQLFAGSVLPTMQQQTVQGQSIHMATVQGDVKNSLVSSQTILLFVHGSPGDWKAWTFYLKTPELAGFTQRIAIDRPGFGGSGRGKVMTDLQQQAKLIAELIPKGQKAIVVGHSLGGALAVWMAINAPDKVCGAVSIAGSLSAQYEEPRWYNLLADSVLLRWAVPLEMLWSNQEMMGLSGELRKLEAAANQLRVPTTLIQGGKDSLVDPKTVDAFIKYTPAPWFKAKNMPDETHFLLWEKPSIVVDAIKEIPCASLP